ncbi:ABC transporter substrate-binding protein [Virgisporangium aurantiacum]
MVLLRLNPRTQAAICLVAMLAAAGSSAGCSDYAESAAPKQVDKVTYLTAFGFFGREAYVYVAEEKGFFAARSIEVQVQAGSGASNNLRILAAGGAQFSANDLSGVMILQGGGKYRDEVRAVAAIQQQTLNSIMVLGSSGIRAPKDLEGKTLPGPAGATPQLLFPAYAARAGFDPDTVAWQTVDPAQTPAALAAGRVHGIGQFTVAKGTVEKAVQGREVIVLPYSDWLGDLYGNALIATTELIAKNPDLVKRFRDALLDGLRYSIDHPGEAGQILVKYQPTLDAKAAAAELDLMRSTVLSDGHVGALDSVRVTRAIAALQATGQIPAGHTVADFVASDIAHVS